MALRPILQFFLSCSFLICFAGVGAVDLTGRALLLWLLLLLEEENLLKVPEGTLLRSSWIFSVLHTRIRCFREKLFQCSHNV